MNRSLAPPSPPLKPRRTRYEPCHRLPKEPPSTPTYSPAHRSPRRDAREPRVRQRRPPRAAPAQDLGDSNYSEFFGYGGSLFNNTPYEQARPAIAPRAG